MADGSADLFGQDFVLSCCVEIAIERDEYDVPGDRRVRASVGSARAVRSARSWNQWTARRWRRSAGESVAGVEISDVDATTARRGVAPRGDRAPRDHTAAAARALSRSIRRDGGIVRVIRVR